jgi:hypothetical protein
LIGAIEIAVGMRFGPQCLDGLQNVGLLRQESVTQSLGPLHFIAHHGKDLGKGNQRLHTQVPVHPIQCGIQSITMDVLVLPHPLVGFHHLVRESRCHQDLPEQGIRVKSDRREHLVQLFLAEG